MAAACGAWGHRVARGLSQLALAPTHLRFLGDRSAGTVSMDGRVLLGLLRTQPQAELVPAPTIKLFLGMTTMGQVRVLHQAGAADRVRLAAETTRTALLGLGHGMGWVTDFVKAGRSPGMVEPGTQDLVGAVGTMKEIATTVKAHASKTPF